MGSTGVVRKRFLLSPIRKESNSASPIPSPTYSPSSVGGGGGGGNSPIHNNEKIKLNQIKSETVCNNINNNTKTTTNTNLLNNGKKSAIFRGTTTENNRNSVANNTSITRHEEDNSLLIPPVHEIRWWRKLFRQFSNRLHKLNPFTSERDWTITSVQVDRISMILFPMSYLVFNIGYWAYYLGKIGRPL
ncbi:unnamed protein product [Meloidogyne enterolobii]|uniref:Uncharacterized protein n=1 Tax=Meloidogyne enterolobii TaxID=390850 RepID=A0ACB0YHW4_MELEN